ncbi:hypothetical protein SEA_ELINAL_72 [Gordonia phage Elinal]|nr:hypothetical protein SEA_ELINAL_72 [Gordonia phage Elinal]
MSRRKRRHESTRGHSALDNGWFHPARRTVEQVEQRAAKALTAVVRSERVTAEQYSFRPDLVRARAQGKAEGMIIALALIRGCTSKEELRRIKDMIDS